MHGMVQEKLDHLGIIALIVGTPFTAVVVGLNIWGINTQHLG
jgi:predicted membrane channel-forming protein YqfA (hemolysin III family)